VLLYRSAGVSANIYLGITGENALTYVYVVWQTYTSQIFSTTRTSRSKSVRTNGPAVYRKSVAHPNLMRKILAQLNRWSGTYT
jgi:hypothetical protein